MPLPSLTPEQRAAALEKAAEIRKARAQLKEQLKQGKTTLGAVLERAESDDVVGKLKVSAVLQAMPGNLKTRWRDRRRSSESPPAQSIDQPAAP